MCIGPGGAGKTSIAERLGEIAFGEESNWEPGTQPYVNLIANVSDRAYFSPKAFIASALKALYDPFRATSQDIATWNISDDAKRIAFSSLSGRSSRSPGERQMRDAFISIAKLKKVRLIIVDEANLLTLTQLNRVPTDYLESVRLLGDEIGCPIVLLGTTDMLHLLSYSAQINRRTLHIHLDRIRCEDEEGHEEFIALLRHLCGLNDALDLKVVLKLATEIFEWTYGIPGEVVAHLQRAQYCMAGDGCSIVTKTHLEMAKHHPDVQQQMIREADLIDRAFNKGISHVSPPEKRPRTKSVRMHPLRREVGFGTL